MEQWSTGVLRTSEISLLLHHSITPLLHSFTTPLLHSCFYLHRWILRIGWPRAEISKTGPRDGFRRGSRSLIAYML